MEKLSRLYIKTHIINNNFTMEKKNVTIAYQILVCCNRARPPKAFTYLKCEEDHTLNVQLFSDTNLNLLNVVDCRQGESHSFITAVVVHCVAAEVVNGG